MNTIIQIGNKDTQIHNTVCVYSAKKKLADDRGFPYIFMELYINDIHYASLKLTSISYGFILSNQAINMIDNLISYDHLYSNSFSNIFIKDKNSDDVTINYYNQINFKFNRDNYEEFRFILYFSEWFVSIQKVHEGII